MKLMYGDSVLVPNLIPAFRIIDRMVGLLGRDGLQPGSAMLLRPCGSIHTVGMRFSLDVIFVDSDMRVTKVVRGLKPGRLCLGGRGAKAAIEMESGSLELTGIVPGVPLRTTDD